MLQSASCVGLIFPLPPSRKRLLTLIGPCSTSSYSGFRPGLIDTGRRVAMLSASETRIDEALSPEKASTGQRLGSGVFCRSGCGAGGVIVERLPRRLSERRPAPTPLARRCPAPRL